MPERACTIGLDVVNDSRVDDTVEYNRLFACTTPRNMSSDIAYRLQNARTALRGDGMGSVH